MKAIQFLNRRLGLLLLGFAFLFQGSFGGLHAQIVTVKDGETRQVLQAVHLQSKDSLVFVQTDEEGQADISSFKGLREVEIIKTGYVKVILSYEKIALLNHVVLLSPIPLLLLNEIIISSSKPGQNKHAFPNHLVSIQQEDINFQSPQTAADLLGISGEVFIQKSQQAGGSPMIRGFSANKLLYIVDGVRMNTAIFRAGNIQNVISLDPFAIESAEILFGPGSVIYGSDAIGGVMNFNTLTPKTFDTTTVKGGIAARYSSANSEKTGHFDFSVGWKKWAILTSVSSYNFEDLTMGSHGPDDYLRNFYVKRIDSADHIVSNDHPQSQIPTAYSQINLMQKVRFTPVENWDFQYGFHYSETSEYSRYDRLTEVVSSGLPVYAVWNYGPQKWMMNLLTVTNYSNNLFYNKSAVRLSYQYFEESRIDRKFNNTRLRTQLEQVDVYTANMDFVKSLTKQTLFYGLEVLFNNVISTGEAININTLKPIPVSSRYPDSKWSSYAVYLQYQYQMAEKGILQAGMRYNMVKVNSDFSDHLDFYPFEFSTSIVNNNALTGDLGMSYPISKTWTVNSNLSTGFRAPNVDDMGKLFDFQQGDVVVPNPHLKPEYAYNVELSIIKKIGEIISLDATGFYTWIGNVMVRRDYRLNGRDSMMYEGEMCRTLAIQNAASGFVYGIDAGIEINPMRRLKFISRINYQMGKEEMDDGNYNSLRHAAPCFGITRISYQIYNFIFQFYAVYSAGLSYEKMNPEEQQKPSIYAKDENGYPYSPLWYTLNMKLMFRQKHFSITTGVENLTDQRYRPYSSGLTAPGRNFVIALKVNI